MIRRIVQCDYCDAQEDVQKIQLFGDPPLPSGWFRLIDDGDNISHYCCLSCVHLGTEANDE